MYRKSALDLVAYQGEYFDESFFSYKEDVDLAWRLRLAGFTAYYIATAVAIHERGAAMITNLTDRGTIRNRISKSKRVNFLSYRNHLYLLLKYEGINSVLFNPSLIWYEMKKFFYLLIKEPSNLNSIVSICRSIPEIRKKRENISSITRVSKKELNKWFQ
jgi:GT2 family glycosyltransferase